MEAHGEGRSPATSRRPLAEPGGVRAKAPLLAALPAGQITHGLVQCCRQKYSASRLTQITPTTSAIPHPLEGRIAIVTDVGCGMRWTWQRRAREGSQGGFSVSDQPARRRPALKRLRRNFGRQHMSRSKRFGGGSRGRQKRVVLAPVAGVKLMEIFRGPTGHRAIANLSAMEARGIRLQGERAISRKTIAQGRPGVPAHLAVTRVHFVRTIAGA
jgi:hypothetical protein